MTRRTARALLVSSLAAVSACSAHGPSTQGDSSSPGATSPGSPSPTPEQVMLGDATRPPVPVSGGTLLVTKSGLAVAADSDRDGVWIRGHRDAGGQGRRAPAG